MRIQFSLLAYILFFMIIFSILSLLLSNSVTLRRDISILFNRLTIMILIYAILVDITCLSILSKSIGVHGGLLHISNITQVFQIFLFFISILILLLTLFNPRTLLFNLHFSNLEEKYFFIMEDNFLIILLININNLINNFLILINKNLYFFSNS